MRLFLLMCLAAALIAGVISKKSNKNNTIAGVNPKKGDKKNTIAGVKTRKGNKKTTKAGVGSKKGGNKKTTKAGQKQGDWNMYETHPDTQLEPMNVNPNMGAEIII